ncbi:MAG: hypothetical protein FWG26_04650 [Betaproteobacteria bacterium]|jgi:hypothetical protein|nr:hypothetical protein [Betaproteobacteria bacterium]
MLIVMDMENGKVIRDPVATEAEPCVLPPVARVPQAQPLPQPRLQEVSIPPRAACPPPSLDVINVSLSAFDA